MSTVPQTSPQEMSQAEMAAKIAALESEKLNLVDELKNDRTRNRAALDAKETELNDMKALLEAAVIKNNTAPTEEEKIANVVKAVLSERDGQTAAQNKTTAFNQFVNEHTEYHPDNDPSGLKRSALQREFDSFNTSGLVSVNDFVAVIGKAHTLLRGTDTPRQPEVTVPSAPAPTGTSPRQVAPENGLSPLEKSVIERNGWTEERYRKLKESNPDLVDSLLREAPPH